MASILSLSHTAQASLAPALGNDDAQQPEPVPQAPPGATPRTAEHIARLRLDIPPSIQVSHSISYRLAERHYADSRRLDVYRNQSRGESPVFVFFHGGAWRSGHRRQYIPLGVSLALGGITCVVPSYSQAPHYQFPEPLKDAAAVINWVHDNIRQLGGDPRRIVIGGHSSGAQIAAQVALDRRYLDFHYKAPGILRGVVALSGIYAIPPGFEYAFGTQPDYWRQASPLYFVREGAPPFLVVVGSADAPSILRQHQAFTEALAISHVAMETEVYQGEDHSSIIALASLRDSPLQERIRAFVRART